MPSAFQPKGYALLAQPNVLRQSMSSSHPAHAHHRSGSSMIRNAWKLLSPWKSRTRIITSKETIKAWKVVPMDARGINLGMWRCGARTRVLSAVHSTTTASARSSSDPAHAHHRSGSSMKRNACKLLSPWASRTAMVQSPETLMALLVVPMAARGIILGMWKCGARTKVLIAVHTTTNASARLLALQVLQRLPQQCPRSPSMSSSHPAHAHHRSGSSIKRNACRLLGPWASRTTMVQSLVNQTELMVVPMAARGTITGMWRCGARTRVLIAVHTTTTASARWCNGFRASSLPAEILLLMVRARGRFSKQTQSRACLNLGVASFMGARPRARADPHCRVSSRSGVVRSGPSLSRQVGMSL